MHTLTLTQIDNNNLLLTINSSFFISEGTSQSGSITETLKVKINDLQGIVDSINKDPLKEYINNGSDRSILKKLKEDSYNLFNILNLYSFQDFFSYLKKKKPSEIQLILDNQTNIIPFEILHDGKDFLSDYIIFSRELKDSFHNKNHNSNIDYSASFTLVGNPSESKDILKDTNEELNALSNMIKPLDIEIKGPYKNKIVDKIQLIRLLSSTSLLHFSGHYIFKNNKLGWQLYNDLFTFDDILKISKSPDFIFSNACGNSSSSFIKFIKYFLDKGSKSIIGSIGKLPSGKASEFSNLFYHYFLIQGYDVGYSFFLAKNKLIKKYGKDDLFWCFYQIYGSSKLKINKRPNLLNNKLKNTFKYLPHSLSIIFGTFFIFYNFQKNTNNLIEPKTIPLNHICTYLDRTDIVDSKNKISNGETIFMSLSPNSISKPSIDFDIFPDKIYYEFSNDENNFNFDANGSQRVMINQSKQFINPFLNYDNDTLHISYYKESYLKANFDRVNIFFNYPDSELWIKDTFIYLFNRDKVKRYKIPINKLIYLSAKIPMITEGDLSDYSGDYYHQHNLLKGGFKFDNELIMYIKKGS